MTEAGLLDRTDAAASRHPRFETFSTPEPAAQELASSVRTEWLWSVRQRLAQLRSLNQGWDGYDGMIISGATAQFTIQALNQVWRNDLPVPDISPMSDGSLMLEWFHDGRELTIEIERPYVMSVCFETGDGPLLDAVSTDFAILARRIDELLLVDHALAA